MLPAQHCTYQVLSKSEFTPFISHFIALSLSTSVLLTVTQRLLLFLENKVSGTAIHHILVLRDINTLGSEESCIK